MGQFKIIKNHLEVDSRPEIIAKNREFREKREVETLKTLEERFQNKIEFEDYDLFWSGNVPAIHTTKGKISFVRDLEAFEEGLKNLKIDQQGAIEYDARRTNIKYHCRVRFSVSHESEADGRKALYLFFFDPAINTIS